MNCYCCGREIATARKVKIRGWPDVHGPFEPNSPASASYVEELTYRWAVICQPCYSILDNWIGQAKIDGKSYNIAGASRVDRAATIDAEKYRKFQQKEAAKLGIDLD